MAQSHKTAPTSDANLKYWVPRLPTLLSDLATNQGYPQPLLRFDNLLELLTELREMVLLMFTYLWQTRLQNKQTQPDEEGTSGPDLEGSWVQELLSPWSWDTPLSQHLGTFSIPEALWTLQFSDFYRGFMT